MYSASLRMKALPAFYREMTFADYLIHDCRDQYDQPQQSITVTGVHPVAGGVVVVQGMFEATLLCDHPYDFDSHIFPPVTVWDEPDDDELLEFLGTWDTQQTELADQKAVDGTGSVLAVTETALLPSSDDPLADRFAESEAIGRAAFEAAASIAASAGLEKRVVRISVLTQDDPTFVVPTYPDTNSTPKGLPL